MKWTLLILTLICSIILNGQNTTIQTITIEPYLGFENYEHYKRLVLISKDSEIEYIKGFNFEWGYKYQLSVKVTKLNPALSDGTRYEYELDKIILKSKVRNSYSFKLFIDPDIYYKNSGVNEEDTHKSLKLINQSTYLYFKQVEIVVPKKLISKFNKIVQGELGKMGEFLFINNNRIKLINIE